MDITSWLGLSPQGTGEDAAETVCPAVDYLDGREPQKKKKKYWVGHDEHSTRPSRPRVPVLTVGRH